MQKIKRVLRNLTNATFIHKTDDKILSVYGDAYSRSEYCGDTTYYFTVFVTIYDGQEWSSYSRQWETTSEFEVINLRLKACKYFLSLAYDKRRIRFS